VVHLARMHAVEAGYDMLQQAVVLGAVEELIDLEERRRRDHSVHLRAERSTSVELSSDIERRIALVRSGS
jgi:hypothetical protein